MKRLTERGAAERNRRLTEHLARLAAQGITVDRDQRRDLAGNFEREVLADQREGVFWRHAAAVDEHACGAVSAVAPAVPGIGQGR